MKRKISKKDIATLPKLYLLSKKDMFVNVTFQVFWLGAVGRKSANVRGQIHGLGAG